MNFRSKAIMLAKAISVWWGIYFILGCCACFSINMLLGIFGAENFLESISKLVLIPSITGGSLVLGIISYFLSSLLKSLPEKFFRRKLNKILRENGICREYTQLLHERLCGDTKNITCVELANAYLLAGDAVQARKYIEQTDVVSVLDIAQSTGDYRTAAYYYASAAMIYLRLGKNEIAEAAFENGRFYLDALDNDCFAMAAKAAEQCVFGSPDKAASIAITADVLRRKHLRRGAHNDIQGLVLAVKAHALLAAGHNEKALDAANEALKIKVSEVFEKNVTELSTEIQSAAALPSSDSRENVISGKKEPI